MELESPTVFTSRLVYLNTTYLFIKFLGNCSFRLEDTVIMLNLHDFLRSPVLLCCADMVITNQEL